ncbi:MAG: undecaprenyldiphospho-muramoylpentapeptide beta-N-acetylglucosaminyltransferase [Eubacteriales bacterium]|nr:undecaprenyldiphospho-muramoylpentapeptide beta-N-acetylglucosaminyltransferase [Eubacteriales bacterium]
MERGEILKHIILTGGGTAGHVTPNLALLPGLRDRGYRITYIGSYEGIERDLVTREGIEYIGISSGKLRRQLAMKNITDGFRVFRGLHQAKRIIRELQPDIVFSKGGFVTVPVIFAAKKYKVPIVIHESDLTPGLANKLSIPKADRICCNFEETLRYLPEERAMLTGLPIRETLLQGDAAEGRVLTGLQGKKPVLLIMGGSQGALNINKVIHRHLDVLSASFDIIHLCGRGKLRTDLTGMDGYVQYEYVNEELPHLLAVADVVISRAGANAIGELLALKKPHILIPLTKAASRGDQILNAAAFERAGFAYVLPEEQLTINSLQEALTHVTTHAGEYVEKMVAAGAGRAVDILLDLFDDLIVERTKGNAVPEA